MENITTSAFLEDPSDILIYRAIVNQLATRAHSARESREVFA